VGNGSDAKGGGGTGGDFSWGAARVRLAGSMSPTEDQHGGGKGEDLPPLRAVGRGIMLAGAVGVVAGLGAVAFLLLSQAVTYFALEATAGYLGKGPENEHSFMADWFGEAKDELVQWLIVALPAAGGLVSGWLVYTFAPEAEGHGTDSAIEAYHNKRGVIRARVPLVKMIASAVTLGTGGSGGREGPIAQIGAGFGSFLATRLRLSDTDRRVLMAAGIGAGIGAIFHAPLAGSIFAIEVLYRDPDFEAEALIPAFIATTVAYCTLGLIIGVAFGYEAFGPLFSMPEVTFNQPLQLGPFAVLAVLMAAASFFYVRTFYGTERLFARLAIPRHFKPAVGGLLTGIIGLAAFHLLGGMARFTDIPADPADGLSVLSYGYGFLQKVLSGGDAATLTIAALLTVGLGKILTTSLTIGSGGSGGVFGPSMVIGGALGAVVGAAFAHWTPAIVGPEDTVVFAVLGMAAFFAASAKTPVSTLIMVTELTGSYELLLPAMWVCALAYLVSRRWTIYSKQALNRIESPAHRGDFIVDILEGLTVRDALRDNNRHFITIPIEMPLREVVQIITDTRQSSFPVLDHSMRYYGMFSLNDIRRFLYDSDIGDLAVAQDLANDIPPILLSTDLGEVMSRFARSNYEELPVVDADDPSEVIAVLRRVDVISAYNQQLLNTRTEQALT